MIFLDSQITYHPHAPLPQRPIAPYIYGKPRLFSGIPGLETRPNAPIPTPLGGESRASGIPDYGNWGVGGVSNYGNTLKNPVC